MALGTFNFPFGRSLRVVDVEGRESWVPLLQHAVEHCPQVEVLMLMWGLRKSMGRRNIGRMLLISVLRYGYLD